MIEAAFLNPKAVEPGKQVLPYFSPFSDTWLAKSMLGMLIVSPEPFQKLSRVPGKAWVCPVSHVSRNQTFLGAFKKRYSLTW